MGVLEWMDGMLSAALCHLGLDWDLSKRQTNVLAINSNNIFNSPAVAIATAKHKEMQTKHS